MSIKTLDALSLAVLDEDAKIARIAAIWCREMGLSLPSSRKSLGMWVKRDYGPVLDADQIDRLTVRLLDEIKHQTRIRARRASKKTDDPLSNTDSDARLGRVLQAALGPPRAWSRRARVDLDNGVYISGKLVYSGLVAGIIPVSMNLAGIRNPNLLVYRERGRAAKSYWIPGRICDVSDALNWLIPTDVRELMSAFQGPDLQVGHDFEHQSCKVTTPYGEKLVPWRGLR